METMETREIRDKIRQIIADVGAIPEEKITDDARFVEDLDLDSLSLLEIGVDVDYAFQLGLPDERLREIGSLAESVALVESELAARGTREEAVA